MCVCVCVCVCVCEMNSPDDHDIYIGRRVELKKRWITCAGDLLLVVKVCIEPATVCRRADNRRIVHQYTADSSEKHISGFEFKVFP